MQINITDTLRIRQLDKYNFIIEELREVERIKGKNKGKVEKEWKDCGTYHKNELQAIEKVTEKIKNKTLEDKIFKSVESYKRASLKILKEIRDKIENYN